MLAAGLFALIATGYTGEVGGTVTMIGFLFALLFPYKLDSNLINLLGAQVILWISIIIILIVLIGWALKLDEFKLAIAGSFFLAFFTSFFLIEHILLSHPSLANLHFNQPWL